MLVKKIPKIILHKLSSHCPVRASQWGSQSSKVAGNVFSIPNAEKSVSSNCRPLTRAPACQVPWKSTSWLWWINFWITNHIYIYFLFNKYVFLYWKVLAHWPSHNAQWNVNSKTSKEGFIPFLVLPGQMIFKFFIDSRHSCNSGDLERHKEPEDWVSDLLKQTKETLKGSRWFRLHWEWRIQWEVQCEHQY